MDKNRLGKGLGALLSNSEELKSKSNIKKIYTEHIEANPYQPRKEFDRDSLDELAQSIENNGLIQPILCRQLEPEKFQLVAGERRWRAAKIAGLKKIPALIDDFTDHQMMEIALIENIQREDLNPIEEAQAYQKMIDEFAMTQEEVGEKVGKSRSSVANSVRLLNLSSRVQMYVSRGTLSMGHARSLLALKENELQLKVADHIIKNHLSVRETEKLVNKVKKHGFDDDNEKKQKDKDEKPVEKKQKKSEHQKWIKGGKDFAEVLGKDVKVNCEKDKALFTIEFNSYEELQEILSDLNR